MTDDVSDLARILLETQHGWLRGRLAALDTGDAPAATARAFAALHDATLVTMAREEATILPLVRAGTCRLLTRARSVEELVQELRIAHRHLDDLAARLVAVMPEEGPLRSELRALVDDLAEHQLEEDSALFAALPRVAAPTPRPSRARPRA